MTRWGPADGGDAAGDGGRLDRARHAVARRLAAVDDPTPIPRSQPPGCLPVAPKAVTEAVTGAVPGARRAVSAATEAAGAAAGVAGTVASAATAIVRRRSAPTAPTGPERRPAVAPAPTPPSARRSPWEMRTFARRIAWTAFLLLVLSGFVGAARLPIHTYLENQAALADTQQQLADVRESNRRMDEELARFDTDAELERVAREQYGWVKPGEEVYHVPQPAEDPVAVPDVWPFTQLHDRLHAVDPDAPQTAASTTTAPGAPSPTAGSDGRGPADPAASSTTTSTVSAR